MVLLAPEAVDVIVSTEPSIETPAQTYTDSVLDDLDIPGGKQVLIDNPELRHLAVQRSLILYENEFVRRLAYDTPRNRSRLQRAEDMVRVCMSSEVRFGTEQDDEGRAFLDNAVDHALAFSRLKPTLDFVVPQAVDALHDDELAAGYLTRMWGTGRIMEDWLPIIDWGHLQNVGGTDGIEQTSENNGDIAAMKQWAERFSDRRIGQIVGVELEAIDEMLKYPTLFRLPGVQVG